MTTRKPSKDALFSIDASLCEPCHACIRSCPVLAITYRSDDHGVSIDPARCIGCGSCLDGCPQGSVQHRDSVERVSAMLQDGSEVAAMVGPSIAGEFEDITDYRKFVQMIRALGFAFVHEASFGADLVALQYLRLLEESKGKFYISSNCPAVVSYVEKYHPGLTSNLAPIVSPMIATARVLRDMYGDRVRLVYIGPCIAGKDEAEAFGPDPGIDAVLTFTELRKLFRLHGIDETRLEYSEFDPPLGHKGALFPLPEGMLEAAGIDRSLLSGKVISVEGPAGMLRSVEEFGSNITSIQHHFNLFYCEGCIMGPGTSREGISYAGGRLWCAMPINACKALIPRHGSPLCCASASST